MQNEENENGNGHRDYASEQLFKALNIVLDPDDEKLLSLTDIFSAREAHHHALQITRQAALNPDRKEPLAAIYRNAMLRLKRSKGARALLLTFGVAQGQVRDDSDLASEEADL